ncbi:hypothetical protein AWR36_010510 [Microbulbifer flavimaris]|uniref:ATP-binding protein n=2 Tax=Pseudomonadota TaxID=1224 RepID=A0ABX4HYD5_9GAMM|nr:MULTISPECIES: hypothetical protein [Microbulbifer]KUJ82966.1 hypothetical protein AVO43_10490 [Microbulbifer sp. ZGT114]PCO05150.1 hypothetical protein AWR36_010510 [Microbulbifer flavimaris]
MSLSEKIVVNTHYTRSINLERDADSLEVVKSYIPTSRALSLFRRISEGFSSEQAPRAWSIVGPYGSGKSSCQSFSAHLLSAPNEKPTKAAQAILKSAAPELAKQFAKEIKGTNGYLRVLVTGSPEPMAYKIIKALCAAAEKFWAGQPGAKPKVLRLLKDASKKSKVATSEVVELVKQLLLSLGKANSNGILLVIDELGKFLEYEARHYGANDIYLLQSLAEHACEGGNSRLFLFVLLHQSFEQYAKGLGESLKNEWSKVQGRFEEVPFLESSEQVLRVVNAAFSQKLTKAEASYVSDYVASVVDTLNSEDALPGVLDKSSAIELFRGCYPLHPVSAILLPLLCQKVAQNERTLFSYLGSHEEFGLQDMLARIENAEDWIYPHDIYDYFITNQPAVLGDYTTHRRWAEVVTSIERLGDAPENQVNMLKTVGILNIIGAKGGFKASKAILQVSAKSPKRAGLKPLLDKSIITYRKFSNEYRVWQGSDFDLEAAVAEELSNLGDFSLAEQLNKEKALMPIVARRYTIKSGALRYFVPEFIDADNYKKSAQASEEPRILFYLAAAQDDEKHFKDHLINFYSALDITALCLNGSQLREATAEVLALRRIQNTRQELNTDPVAKREFEDRLTAAELSQNSLLQELFERPQDARWFHHGKQITVVDKRGFQEAISDVLANAFNKSPFLHNELINRDRPSSQANAARNKLLIAMLNNADQVDLGIEKFPPEKAIYRSILRETGLHSRKEGKFQAPPKTSALYLVWQRIEQFLDETENAPRSFAELNQELIAPPYGVKAGVLPILYMAVYVVYQHELALYEERRYRPFFTDEMVDRFVKRPDQFTVQRFRISGLRASIYEEYNKIIEGGDKAKKTVIELVRPLANWLGALEHYTLKTKSGAISGKAKRVRDAFQLAKSPESLLFEDLPKALGFENELKQEVPNLEGMAATLQGCLQELKAAYPKMLDSQVKNLSRALHMDEGQELADLRRKAIGRYEGLDQHTVDIDGLKAFIKRLTKKDGDDSTWLENVLMFLGRKPTAKWTDTDLSEADVRLSDFAKRILDLETLRLHYDRSAEKLQGDFDVILLKSLKKGCDPIDEVVAIDKARHEAIQDVKGKLKEALSAHKDSELQLAVLAELVDEFLNERQKASEDKKSKAKKPKLKQVRNG